MKKCKKCEINYVMNENEDYCPLCKAKIVDVPIDTGIRKTGIDNIKTKHIGDVLIVGVPYDTAAKRIYLQCCQNFGFDEIKAGNFAMQKTLYASNATIEGYGVWFLAHSNYTNTKNGNWENEFIDNDKILIETWDVAYASGLRFNEELNTRVVFAKKEKYYEFMGIYKWFQNKENHRFFERISTIYPMNYK